MNSERIYLDHAATTPMRAEVSDAMQRACADADFNPSSLHGEGRRAAGLLDAARHRIASLLGASSGEIIFTSSGTESNNLAIRGVARASRDRNHIVTAAFEHSSVGLVLEELRTEGFAVTVLPVGSQGLVDPSDFAAALRPQTVLASIMYANNEIGTVQPIPLLASLAHEQGAVFHCDAVAVASWLPLDTVALGVDLLSLSAHKCYGPKGCGLLFVRRGVGLAPMLLGGGQEHGRRAGTENLRGIVGFSAALERASDERLQQSKRVAALRDRLEDAIVAAVPEVRINSAGPRLPNLLNVSFAGVEASELLIALDLEGIAVSAGSACASGSPLPSHVIIAMGLESRWQRGAVRFSLGRGNSAEEIERVAATLPAVVARLRGSCSSPALAAVARGDG